MTNEKRNELIDFCVRATAYLHDVDEERIDRSEFKAMDDDTLLREADWLDDMLGK